MSDVLDGPEPSGPAGSPAQAGAANDPTRPLRTTLRSIATVVAPASLATALLFYFGWSRTSYQAAAMGLNESLFGYSTQEYMLRSVDAMFWPLFAGAAALLVALMVHGAVVTWAGDALPLDRRRVQVLARGIGLLVVLGSLSLGLGALGVRNTNPSRLVSLYSPVCVTLGIVFLGYAVHLRGRFLRPRPTQQLSEELRTVRLIGGSVIVLLLLVSLLWDVSRYAQLKGLDLAQVVEEQLPSRPDVSVYSPKRLQLQPPVTETVLPSENSAYLYRYTGLKLLFRAEHTYFLRPEDPSGAGVNILIRESPDVRVEFAAPE